MKLDSFFLYQPGPDADELWKDSRKNCQSDWLQLRILLKKFWLGPGNVPNGTFGPKIIPISHFGTP